MTAREVIERITDICIDTGFSLDDLHLNAVIMDSTEWNKYNRDEDFRRRFIVNAEPFACVNTFIIQNPDVPFILELQPHMGAEDNRKKYLKIIDEAQ